MDMLFTYLIGGFGAWAAALMLLVAVQGDSLNRGGLRWKPVLSLSLGRYRLTVPPSALLHACRPSGP